MTPNQSRAAQKMDVSQLTSELTFQDTMIFQAPPETVYDALDTQSAGAGAPVETHVIAGHPRQVGYAQQARFHYGPLDLIMIETIKVAQRPTRLVIEQQPDALQRHDPNEREIPFLDSMIEDLDATFADQFGSPPLVTQVSFDLSPHQDGTQMQITVTVLDAPKLGWFKRRAWRKNVKQQVDAIKSRMMV